MTAADLIHRYVKSSGSKQRPSSINIEDRPIYQKKIASRQVPPKLVISTHVQSPNVGSLGDAALLRNNTTNKTGDGGKIDSPTSHLTKAFVSLSVSPDSKTSLSVHASELQARERAQSLTRSLHELTSHTVDGQDQGVVKVKPSPYLVASRVEVSPRRHPSFTTSLRETAARLSPSTAQKRPRDDDTEDRPGSAKRKQPSPADLSTPKMHAFVEPIDVLVEGRHTSPLVIDILKAIETERTELVAVQNDLGFYEGEEIADDIHRDEEKEIQRLNRKKAHIGQRIKDLESSMQSLASTYRGSADPRNIADEAQGFSLTTGPTQAAQALRAPPPQQVALNAADKNRKTQQEGAVAGSAGQRAERRAAVSPMKLRYQSFFSSCRRALQRPLSR